MFGKLYKDMSSQMFFPVNSVVTNEHLSSHHNLHIRQTICISLPSKTMTELRLLRASAAWTKSVITL